MCVCVCVCVCVCARARAQLGTTLCNPMACSPPGSSIHGILQARILDTRGGRERQQDRERHNETNTQKQREWGWNGPYPGRKQARSIPLPMQQDSVILSAKSLQSCLTLCDPMDCSPPGFSVHGIHQARILEWVAISSSRGSSWPSDWTHVS